MWGKLQNVPSRAFEGGREDIDTLDFIDYEAGFHPEGDAGAAVIWGGVIVATGLLSWAVGDEKHFVLANLIEPDFDRVMIIPYTRIAEVRPSFPRGNEMFNWLLEEAVLRLCMLNLDGTDSKKLLALLHPDNCSFRNRVRQWMDIHHPGKQEDLRRRNR